MAKRWLSAGLGGLLVALTVAESAASAAPSSGEVVMEGQELGAFWRSYCVSLRPRLLAAGAPALLVAEPPPRATGATRGEFWRLRVDDHDVAIPATRYSEALVAPPEAREASVILRNAAAKQEIALQTGRANVLAVDDPEAWTRSQLQDFTDRLIETSELAILDMAALGVWLELAFRKTPHDLQCVPVPWEWDWKIALAVPLKRVLIGTASFDRAYLMGREERPSWILATAARPAGSWQWILPSAKDPARYYRVAYSGVSIFDVAATFADQSMVDATGTRPAAPPWIQVMLGYLLAPSPQSREALIEALRAGGFAPSAHDKSGMLYTR